MNHWRNTIRLHLPALRRGGGVAVVVSALLVFVGYFVLLRNSGLGELDYSSYDYHVAIISDETDTAFWEAVYTSAQQAGEEYGIYVEQMDDGLVDSFSMEDAINVAIYAGVDGILLRPTEGKLSEALIDKAYEAGIPVITMQKDLPSSNRQGFVGINDYFLGQEYGKQVVALLTAESQLITVLVPGTSFDETSQNWFQQGLSSTMEQYDIQIDLQVIQDDKGLNNAEDIIHDIAEGRTAQPDIILCLDETITQSTSQLVRESGLADQIQIIGSYDSTAILEAIIQGDLESTISIDAQSLGRLSVEALMTYLNYHMVSYYTEVGTTLIDYDKALAAGEEGIHEEHVATAD